jgi:hypothetical protein
MSFRREGPAAIPPSPRDPRYNLSLRTVVQHRNERHKSGLYKVNRFRSACPMQAESRARPTKPAASGAGSVTTGPKAGLRAVGYGHRRVRQRACSFLTPACTYLSQLPSASAAVNRRQDKPTPAATPIRSLRSPVAMPLSNLICIETTEQPSSKPCAAMDPLTITVTSRITLPARFEPILFRL